MAKIAVDLEKALARRAAEGARGQTDVRLLASGNGWKVEDVVCTSGPQDRPFEERHSGYTIAIVAAGSFQYRGSAHCAHKDLLTPGSLILGNAGQTFECSHEHGSGDRCISFWYAPHYFERLAADAGARGPGVDFNLCRLPPLREVSPMVARACIGLGRSATGQSLETSWEEFSVHLAATTVQLAGGFSIDANDVTPSAIARVTRAVRAIEALSSTEITLGFLAQEAGLSPYHFLRTFERLTGVTPHQFVLRARLREAAIRVAMEPSRIIDVALESGFGDVSNFTRTFRKEFGLSPRAYRALVRRGNFTSAILEV